MAKIERKTGWRAGENTFGSFYPSLWTPPSLYVAAVRYLSTMLAPRTSSDGTREYLLNPPAFWRRWHSRRVTYLHMTYTYSQRGIARVTADSAGM